MAGDGDEGGKWGGACVPASWGGESIATALPQADPPSTGAFTRHLQTTNPSLCSPGVWPLWTFPVALRRDKVTSALRPVTGDWRISAWGARQWGTHHLHRKRLEAEQTHARRRCLLMLTDDLLPDVLTTAEDHLYCQVVMSGFGLLGLKTNNN